MSGISRDKLDKYKKLAERDLWDFREPKASAIFRRMEAEGCSLNDYAFNPYGGFFRAPFTRELSDVDIALVGVPMENTVPERTGQKFGPAATRRWSHVMGPIHHVTGVVPFDLGRIIDYGDADFSHGFNVEKRIESIHETFVKLVDRDITTLAVGGEHTITYPILKAHAEKGPLGLIHIDAHGDSWGSLGGADINDASIIRVAISEGIIDPERTIQIGLRGRSFHFWSYSFDVGARVVPVEEFQEKGPAVLAEEAGRIVGDDRCYLTLDVDVLDPAHMPGTGLPEPFGLTTREVRDFIRGLRGLNLVGADITELCPPADPTDMSANIVAGFAFEMLCLITEAHTARTGRTRKTHWTRKQEG